MHARPGGAPGASRRWSALVGACVALLTVALTAFAVDRVDSSARIAVEQLGYGGPSFRITALPGAASSDHFSDELVGYAREHSLSVASTRWYESGVVTLFDPVGAFTNSHGRLVAAVSADEDSTALAVSSGLGATSGDVAGALAPGRSADVEFLSDVMFEGRYPIALVSPHTLPFGSGVYLVAGRDVDDEAVLALFDDAGLTVIDATVDPGSSLPATVRRAFTSLYGLVVTFFWLTLALCTFLTVRIFAALRRRRYRIARVLGAAPRDVSQLVLGDVAPALAGGLLGGAGASVALVLTTAALSPATGGARLVAAAAALAVSAVICVGTGAFAVHAEVRRVGDEDAA